MWRHRQQLLDVFVKILAPPIGDRISDMSKGARHERQGPWLSFVPGFFLELCQQRDLEVVKVVIVSQQLPVTAIFHFSFNNVPILVVIKAVTGNRGRNRRQKLLRSLSLKRVLIKVLLTLMSACPV